MSSTIPDRSLFIKNSSDETESRGVYLKLMRDCASATNIAFCFIRRVSLTFLCILKPIHENMDVALKMGIVGYWVLLLVGCYM